MTQERDLANGATSSPTNGATSEPPLSPENAAIIQLTRKYLVSDQ